jgi:hypothetical protein
MEIKSSTSQTQPNEAQQRAANIQSIAAQAQKTGGKVKVGGKEMTWEDYKKQYKVTASEEQNALASIGKAKKEAELKKQTEATATTTASTTTASKTTQAEVASIASQIDQASAQALTASIKENVEIQKYSNKLNEENKKNLAEINANTKAMVELTKAMQVIAAAQYQYATTNTAPIKLSVDGKTLSAATLKYERNTKGQGNPK